MESDTPGSMASRKRQNTKLPMPNSTIDPFDGPRTLRPPKRPTGIGTYLSATFHRKRAPKVWSAGFRKKNGAVQPIPLGGPRKPTTRRTRGNHSRMVSTKKIRPQPKFLQLFNYK